MLSFLLWLLATKIRIMMILISRKKQGCTEHHTSLAACPSSHLDAVPAKKISGAPGKSAIHIFPFLWPKFAKKYSSQREVAIKTNSLFPHQEVAIKVNLVMSYILFISVTTTPKIMFLLNSFSYSLVHLFYLMYISPALLHLETPPLWNSRSIKICYSSLFSRESFYLLFQHEM